MLVNRRKKKETRRGAVRQRVRRKVRGATERPRMTVFRSNRQLHLQIIDDDSGRTLVSVSTMEPAFRKRGQTGGANREAATEAGKLLAERAAEAGIKQVVFDRSGYDFHGRIKAVADAAREGGLDF